MWTMLDYYHLVTGKTRLQLLLVTNTDIHIKKYFFFASKEIDSILISGSHHLDRACNYTVMSNLVLDVCFDFLSDMKIRYDWSTKH